MSYDNCLGCGVLLPVYVYDCPVCGFDNSFGEDLQLIVEGGQGSRQPDLPYEPGEERHT